MAATTADKWVTENFAFIYKDYAITMFLVWNKCLDFWPAHAEGKLLNFVCLVQHIKSRDVCCCFPISAFS